MNGDKDDVEDIVEEELSEEEISEADVLAEVDDDNVGDLSVELNVQELVAKLEEGDDEDTHHKAEIRRKLEELREQREEELDSTFNFNLDDDI